MCNIIYMIRELLLEPPPPTSWLWSQRSVDPGFMMCAIHNIINGNPLLNTHFMYWLIRMCTILAPTYSSFSNLCGRPGVCHFVWLPAHDQTNKLDPNQSSARQRWCGRVARRANLSSDMLGECFWFPTVASRAWPTGQMKGPPRPRRPLL